jgi:glycosyltransferase involved in cell wall biosynthesis
MIDILLATYNGEKFLKQQIDSILAQSNQDWQLLIRDDNSSDSTVNIIKDYAVKYPHKIRLIEDNRGRLGPALNFGKLLEHADNDYVMFSDQDDVWLPDKIDLTLNTMKDAEEIYPNMPILVHTDLKVVNEDLKIIADSLWSYCKVSPLNNSLNKIIYRNVATGCTTMINRKAVEVSKPIPPEARVHDWWVALNVAKTGKLVHVSLPTILYRQHPQSIIGAKRSGLAGFGVLIKKLRQFIKQLPNDYLMIKKVYPKVKLSLLIVHSIYQTITSRL